MNIAIVVALIGVLATPFAVFVTWIVNRKSNIADIYGTLTESSQNAVETMKTTMDTLHEELKNTQNKVIDLTQMMGELELQVLKLKSDLTDSVRENNILKSRIYMLTAALQESAAKRNDSA